MCKYPTHASCLRPIHLHTKVTVAFFTGIKFHLHTGSGHTFILGTIGIEECSLTVFFIVCILPDVNGARFELVRPLKMNQCCATITSCRGLFANLSISFTTSIGSLVTVTIWQLCFPLSVTLASFVTVSLVRLHTEILDAWLLNINFSWRTPSLGP